MALFVQQLTIFFLVLKHSILIYALHCISLLNNPHTEMYFSPISSRKSTPRLNSRSSLVQRFHLVLSFATSLFLSFLRLTFFESLFAICFAVTMFFYFRLSIFNLGCQCLHHVPRKFYKVARFCSNTEFVRFHLFSSFVRLYSYFLSFCFLSFLPHFLFSSYLLSSY